MEEVLPLPPENGENRKAGKKEYGLGREQALQLFQGSGVSVVLSV